MAMRYRFEPVAACNMCGHDSARVLGRRLNVHQGLHARKAVGVATTVVACRTCGLVYSNPRPVPEPVAKHYDRLPEDYWQSGYFQDEADYFGAAATSFKRLWAGEGTPRALDIGAGIGKAMRALARNGFDVFGLEPSRAFRDHALA